MLSVNKVLLVGHLGKAPELKYTGSGDAVATFSLATNTAWKDEQGAKQTATEWHEIVCWKHTAEFAAEHLKSGMQVFLEGYLKTTKYAVDGESKPRYRTNIVAGEILMLGKKEVSKA